MSASAAQLASRLQSAGQGINRANRVGVEKACLAGKNVMVAAMASAIGGNRLSGVGKSGAKVGVRYDVKGYQNPVGIIRYTGPVHLANNPTSAHEILPRGRQTTAKGNRRRGAKALRTPSGAFARVQHPGTKGEKFAEKAEPIVIRQSRGIIASEVNAHLARTFVGR